ncbi:MAG TPA: asparagine synthase-related protein [Rhizobiaceae bacterium]|nr:asparagine synthase-related protein [Rhizobiaceae bacterium]
MSGLAGIVAFEGGRPVSVGEIERSLARMAPRARDGQRTWWSSEASFGQAWLNTTGETAPGLVAIADGAAVIVADCRLDNREDLAAQLGIRDAGAPDAALILKSYLKWADACVDQLVGDFAFAIWDAVARRLFCARDHFGVKPFYFHSGASRFLFASEIKAIFADGDVRRSVDERQLAGFLAGLPDDVQATPFAGIERLPAGHCASVRNGKIALSRYWQPEPSACRGGRDHVDEFRHLFTSAVANRLRGTQNVAAMLSGGLDSSSIACVAAHIREKRGERLSTYSLIFDERSGMGEGRFIDDVLARGNFVGHRVPVEDEHPFAAFDEILDEQDGVFLAPGIATTRRLYEAAGNDGVRVLLNGHGGDEVVSHAPVRVNALAGERRWLELWREVRGLSAVHGTSSISTFLRLFATFGPLSPFAKVMRQITRMRHSFTSDATSIGPAWLTMINADLVRATDLRQRFYRASRAPRAAMMDESLFHRWQLSSGLISHAFEVLDKSAAAFGIEPRYPFWDKALVEFCLALPAEQKLSNGWSRLILRRAMEGVLPPSVQWRRDKVDFKPNLVGGMLRNHKPLLDVTLHAEADRISRYVNVDGVRKAYGRVLTNPSTAALDDVLWLWRTVSLSLWLKRLEGAPA